MRASTGRRSVVGGLQAQPRRRRHLEERLPCLRAGSRTADVSTVSPRGCVMVTATVTITHPRSEPAPYLIRGAGGPASCAGRPSCQTSSASPGPPRPQASRRDREQGRRPVPCPGCRPAQPGLRSVASPSPSTRRRPSEPPWGTPSPCPSRRGPPRSPVCLSRRASWIARVALGSALNSAAMSRSTSSSRLRRGRTVSIVIVRP